jgi:acetylornithine deacetylase
VADEEHSSIGAEALVARWTADAAVITEPTDLDVMVGHKGFAWVDVDVFGTAAHGSRPMDGVDAILRMGRVLQALERLDGDLQSRPPHPMLGTGSLHASIIQGGQELSSYPDRAHLEMERRTLPGDPLSLPLEEVQTILGRLERDDPSFRASARLTFARAAYELGSDHPLAQTLSAILGRRGRGGRLGGASFWTDAAVLGHAGIPSVLFGPGGAGLHSPDEYVKIDEVLACRDALVDLARSDAWLKPR